MIVAAGIGIGRIGMYCRLHLPARLVHAIGTSLQPPSFREPLSPSGRSVTMSAAVPFTPFVFNATVPSVCCGVR